jgi:Protein of unknown function (DUF2462)
MAQGTVKAKKPSTAKASGGRHTVLGPKKGARTIAPRKQVLVKNQKMIKVCSTSLFSISLFVAHAMVWRYDMLEGRDKGVEEGYLELY